MRVLISVAPAPSHLQPLVPIARALQRRGHQVLVVCPQVFLPALRGYGLPAVGAGLDWLRAEPERFFPRFSEVAPAERTGWLIDHVYADQAPRRLVPELNVLFDSWQPNLILRDQAEFASWLVAEQRGVPHVSFGYGLGLLEQDRRRMAPGVARLRAELNLPPDPRLERMFRHLRFEFAPPSYQPSDSEANPRTHHLRFVPSDDPEGLGLPAWAETKPSRPRVVVTLGNNYNRVPGLLEGIAAALATLEVEVVLLVGRNRAPESLGTLPAGARALSYLPLSRLLPTSALLVSHAGFNTIMTAACAGLPMVLVPIDSDQPTHARRCQALGLAQMLDAAEPLGEALRRTVPAMLADAGGLARIAAFRRDVEALPDADYGVDLLERLVVAERP